MSQDKTSLFNIKDIDNRFISDILEEVWDSLEERGYTKEEVDQILDEARTEEEANKPFYDGWKWYNWLLFVIIILAIIGGIAGFAIWLSW